jgi:hypothetical protein
MIFLIFKLKNIAKIDTLYQGYQFRSVSPGMAETFHTNSKNRIKWNKFHLIFKSRSAPDFSAKFHPERSGVIPHVPFRS